MQGLHSPRGQHLSLACLTQAIATYRPASLNPSAVIWARELWLRPWPSPQACLDTLREPTGQASSSASASVISLSPSL